MKNASDVSQLSYGQKALWYLSQLEPWSTAYHLGACLKLSGPLDEAALAAAWSDMLSAHPLLRTRYESKNGLPSAVVDEAGDPLTFSQGGAQDAARMWDQIARRPFSLDRERPARGLLLRAGPEEARLILCMHHIAGDLWSSAVILRELSACYVARQAGRAPAQCEEQADYASFAADERRWVDGPRGREAWAYWRGVFEGHAEPPLFVHEAGRERGGEIPVALDPALGAEVRRAARVRGSTPYAMLLAGYARLLGEEVGRDEIVIGTPAATRSSASLQDTVGYLVNAVPILCPLTAADPAAAVAAAARAALERRRFPFPLLIERLRLPRTAGTTPLFQTMFAYQSLPRASRALVPLAVNASGARWDFGGGLSVESEDMVPFDAQFPVSLTLGGDGDGFSGRLIYDGRRVTIETARALASRFPEAVSSMIAPSSAARRAEERVEDLFAASARRTPDAVAASENGRDFTYAEVDARSTRIAAGLDAALVGREGPVALQMPSSADASVIILAILKSGRTFLPIDLDEPVARRNEALKRARACVLIVAPGRERTRLPDGVHALDAGHLERPVPAAPRGAPSRAAYIVFTSGTTGVPKAVEVGHASVINHARAMTLLLGLRETDRVLQFHTLAFDAAFEEIFPTWTAGAGVVYEPAARGMGAPALLDAVERVGVTILNLPTSHWHTLTEEAARAGLRPSERLRALVVGGERASEKAYAAWRAIAPRCRWINTYGPTETTITALAYALEPGAPSLPVLPIGKPIDGVTTLIEEGELLIGGAGVGLGYRGDPAETSKRFVERRINGRIHRFYKTGDRVRVRADGEYEFLGRSDRQLKIRGFRVDPEEIERALREHPAVSDAAVRPSERGGEIEIDAWITRADKHFDKRAARDHLAALLPPYMMPARIVFSKRLPRKASGKLDAAALGVHAIRSRSASGASGIANIFAEVLGRKVGIDDDFFLNGGHSLLAIRLLSRIESNYDRRLTAADFASAPTPAGVWKALSSEARPRESLRPEAIPETCPLTVQQRRALLAHDVGRPELANIALLFHIRGRANEAALTRALEAEVARQPLLRCAFIRAQDGLAMREAAELVRVERRILRGRVEEFARQEARRPFVPDGLRPWLRVFLTIGPGGRRHLLVVTHHAVADGWSLELLLGGARDSTPAPADDYRAYALRQFRAGLGSERAESERGEKPRIPFRRAPLPGSSWIVRTRELVLPRKTSDELRRVAMKAGVTPFALSMACFKVLIHRYAGQSDVALGTMVSNRDASNASLFGPLQSPALIRDNIRSNESIVHIARRVSRSLARAQERGLADLARSFEDGVQFISHDSAMNHVRIAGAELLPVPLASEDGPFELCVAASTAEPRMRFEFEHRTAVYSAQAVERLARQYEALLASAAAAPKRRISALSTLPQDEALAFVRREQTPLRPREELLHSGFELNARRRPNAIAVVTEEARITYRELDEAAERVAVELTRVGTRPGDLVAIHLTKGIPQVAACLAVLKAGGAYVPVDPALPAARRDALLARGFRAIIGTDGVRALTPGTPRRRRKPTTGALAYVIFTSGSTGAPKGVMITHRQAMTTIAEISRRFAVGPGDRVLAVSSLGFDLSVYDLFGVLRAGGTVVMPYGHDPAQWARLCVSERVTVWDSVPCLLELLLDEPATGRGAFSRLRLVMLSGDFIPLPLARRVREEFPAAELVSLGGATEGSIWSIAREVGLIDTSWRSIPYGRALRNQELYVLDSSLRHCPAGVTGELYIAGAGVAAGYWRDEAETARRFLRRPGLGRLYRTGDQGRYMENGEIEILGRVDEQVKIDGVRVELGEIEAALSSHPLVRHALADVRSAPDGRKRIVAFVAVPAGTAASDVAAHVRRLLPTAMLPSGYALLERLPLTANGKVDRAALRDVEPPSAPTNAAPADSDERWIAGLWSELLGGAPVGVDNDFFALGGHSLLAIKMLQRVRAHFHVDLPLALVVERPTVRGLAAAVRGAANTETPVKALPSRLTVDLERDAEPPDVASTSTGSTAAAVLLTGVTGHLGAAVLAALLRDPGAKVRCLIRARTHDEARRRLASVLSTNGISHEGSRVEAVLGDLGRPGLGLEPEALRALALSVRAVYHCAAEVNFIARYERLSPSNVGGTREMIRIASLGGAVLHHVSSVAVFPYGGGRVLLENDDISRVDALRGGYAQSKWVSERMVWKAAQRGLKAVVYRPAQIVGRAPGAAAHDLFDHAARACRAVRAVPDIDAGMDMVTADFAAAAIVALSEDPASPGHAYHLVHPRPVALRDYAARLQEPLPVVSLEEWLARVGAEAARTEDASLQLVSLLTRGLERNDLTPPTFDCAGATAVLERRGIICPPIGSP